MNKSILFAIVILLAPVGALGGDKADIEVMTQNQYLGATLTPIVTAGDPVSFNLAVINALLSIAGNNFPERVQGLAETIADKNPHLVGLQEVFSFECIPNPASLIPGACFLFDAAFNDHLSETLNALADHGANYYVAATVQDLTIPSAGFPFPGLPVFLDADLEPEFFVTVIDRDVILARNDVVAIPVPFVCAKPSIDGCNYDTIAVAPTLAGPINIERGFVGVDATVNGEPYRFINTHLEVQFPAPDPLAPAIQATQATQLIASLNLPPPAPGSRILVVGDINSSPVHPLFPDPVLGPFHPPYQQLANGTNLIGVPFGAPYTDIWHLRPGKPPGFTCCQLADLSNPVSTHDERIDVIFSLSVPMKVKANVLDDEPSDKTASRLWPSDHSSVIGELTY